MMIKKRNFLSQKIEDDEEIEDENKKDAVVINVNNNNQYACCLKIVKHVQKGTWIKRTYCL